MMTASKTADGLTEKQAAFARAYIETGNASEAYRLSYDAARMKDETVHVKASELLKNGKVTVRIADLQAEAAERHDITVDSLVVELEEARKLAIDTEAPGAAVSATMGKAKLLGLIVEKSEIAGKDGQPLLPEPSARDLSRAVLDILRSAQLEDAAEPDDDDPVDADDDEHENGPAGADLNPAAAPRVWTFNPATGRLEPTNA